MTSRLSTKPIQAEIVTQDSDLLNDTNALLTAWLHGKAPSTKELYRNAVSNFFEFGGNLFSGIITLQQWQETLSQHYKVTTANKQVSAIRSLFRFAHRMGLIDQNPTIYLKDLKPSKEKAKQSKSINQKICSVQEIIAIANAAKYLRDKLMVLTAYRLGLRIDELLRLHWDDFFQINGDWLVTITGKNGKIRELKLETQWVEQLRQLGTNGWVFQTANGEKVKSQIAHKSLKRMIKRAGVNPEISWHWFRHSMVSHSLYNGASLESIRKKAGHSSIATTQIYWHEQENANQFIEL